METSETAGKGEPSGMEGGNPSRAPYQDSTDRAVPTLGFAAAFRQNFRKKAHAMPARFPLRLRHALAVAGLALLAASGPVSGADPKVLNIYNWSDYIADDTI